MEKLVVRNTFIEDVLFKKEHISSISFEDFSSDNRLLWDNLPEKIKSDAISKAEEELKGGFAYLPLSLYRDFKRSGNRRNYEDLFFSKRNLLSDLVIAECLENQNRFIEEIEDGIWSILSEPAWAIPAHNSYIRDTEQLDTPVLSRPILDLFACETAEILALTKCVLHSKLNPILIQNIEWALKTRITIPYTTDSFWWMGASGALNNWSPWCTQNVLIATLSDPSLDDKTRFKIIKSAIITLDGFISSYKEDGACDEGASYYHAAALALFGALTILEGSCGEEIRKIYKEEKIKAMASFIEDVHIKDDIYLNFADCSPKAGALGAREYLFAKAVGNAAMAHHAALDFMSHGWREEDNNYNLFYKLLAMGSYNEIRKEAEREGDFKKPAFKVFKDTEIALYREKDITLAIKGGSNGESHNHNDVGTISLYKGAEPLLIDIGVETYTKTTFSPQRYTLLPMQSLYHNLVNFPPVQQKDGMNFHAEDVVFGENSASMDITPAFEKTEGLTSYKRRMEFNREDGTITIFEDIDSTLTPVLTLMSVEKPEAKGNELIYDSFSISFDRDIRFEVETMDITDERLRRAWPDKLYRSLITLPGSVKWIIKTA